MKTTKALALAFTVLALLSVLVVGCRPDRYAELRKQLKTSQQQWAAQKAANYSYTLRIGTFSPLPEVNSPVVITVKDGAPYSIVYVADGKPATDTFFQRADTTEELFGIIQQAIDSKDDYIYVAFEASLGYPVEIKLDPRKDAIEEESTYTVSNLKISQ
jgi:hypothetical protein